MPEENGKPGLRPFWSGTITFGLVSVSVNLYPATTSRRPRLRMVAPDGSLLRQRYYCPEHDREVGREEIVRGYETGGGEVVVLTDEELDTLAPEKTREIDLRRFVERSELDPLYFERSYLLSPQEGHAKAYRLLTEAMDRTGRAGLATFVMREKEYLVAILSRDGLLHAETMRFPHEVRVPADVGLEPPEKVDDELVSALREAIEAHASEAMDEADLEDPFREGLLALARGKLRKGEDVREPSPDADVERGSAETRIVDLMDALKRSLAAAEGGDAEAAAARRPAARAARGAGSKKRGGGSGDDLEERTRKELYERARELDIPGRSSMSKEELVDAIRSA